MRRFWAFVCMVMSLIVMVVFNVQSVYESNNLSLEYAGGREAVIECVKRDDGDAININTLADKFAKRLDDAGANNSQVEVVGTDNQKVQVRVSLSTNTDEEFNNIIRVLSSNTTLTFTNSNNDFVLGSELLGSESSVMVLDYNDVTPIPKFVIGNPTSWNNFIANNDSIEDETLKSTVYVWANKTEEDTYEKAFGDDARDDVKSKIIATLNTANYAKEDDESVGYITIDTDESGKNFSIASARSYVAARNASDFGFNVEYLYYNTIPATISPMARNLMIIGICSGLFLLCLGLSIGFGLSGLVGSLSLAVSTLFSLMTANFVGFVFTPISALAVLFSMIIGTFVIVYSFEKIKEESKKGKSIDKAHYEGFRKSFNINLYSNGLVFFVALFTFFIGQGMIKTFCGYIIIGAILNFLLTYFLTKWQTYWLVTSPVLNKNSRLVGLDEKETKTKVKVLEKNFIKPENKNKQKKISLISLGFTVVAVVACFLFTGLTSGSRGIFNASDDYAETYRTNIKYVTERTISDDRTFVDYDGFIANLEENDILKADQVKSYTFNRLETLDAEYVETYTTYISMQTYEHLTAEQADTISNYVLGGFGDLSMISSTYYDETEVNSNVSRQGNVVHNNFYFYLCSGLIVVFAAALYLCVFGINASLQVLLTMGIEYGIGMSLLTITRLPFNSMTAFGVYFALLVTAVSFIPVYQRYRELKRDTKTKYPPVELREKMINQSMRESFVPVSFLYLGEIILSVVALCFSSTTLMTASIIAIVMGIIGWVYTYFCSYYDYLFFKAHIRIKKINIKHKNRKPLQVNKNEPQETIIPGIND